MSASNYLWSFLCHRRNSETLKSSRMLCQRIYTELPAFHCTKAFTFVIKQFLKYLTKIKLVCSFETSVFTSQNDVTFLKTRILGNTAVKKSSLAMNSSWNAHIRITRRYQTRLKQYNVTMWRVCVTTVAMERQKYFPFLLFVFMQLSTIWKFYYIIAACVFFALFSSYKNFVLLLTIATIKHYECVCVFLP